MILDLFAGPGGWDEGMRSIGITDVVGLEWDAAACSTRAAAGHATIRCDVAEYPTAPFVGKVRGLIASPPCQALSMAGKGLGRQEIAKVHRAVERCRGGWRDDVLDGPWLDPRTPLILQPLRWAWALRPEWIACEQVPPGLGVWQHMADVLRSWGYAADARILCAADYGVPQTRDRAFLIASTGALRWPETTHAEKPQPSLFGGSKEPWVTMAQALGWEPGSRAWDRRVGGFAADADVIPDTRPAPTVTLSHGRDVWRLRGNNSIAGGPLAERGMDEPSLTVGSRTDRWVVSTGTNSMKHSRSLDEMVKYERSVSEPAPTIDAKAPAAWCVHPAGERNDRLKSGDGVRIEVDDAAVLQGFSRGYPWSGTESKKREQVGNVVCPPVAAALIGALDRTRNVQEPAA